MRKIKNILLFIQLANILASNLLGPIYTAYVNGIGGDLLTAGSALAIDYAVIGALIILSGRLANKYHTEKLQLIVGYILATVVGYGFMIVQNPAQLFIVEIFAGLSIAISSPAFSGIFSAMVESGKHTSHWGDFLGYSYFIAAFAAFFAGILSQNFGISAVFVVMIVVNGLSAIGAIYFYFLTDKNPT